MLERCLGRHTQKYNEHYNHCVRSIVPKRLFNGKNVVEIACKIAACIFNEGYNTILKIMEEAGAKIGSNAIDFVSRHDDTRVQHANRHSLNSSKEARTARKKAKIAESERFKEAEDTSYGAGIAN